MIRARRVDVRDGKHTLGVTGEIIDQVAKVIAAAALAKRPNPNVDLIWEAMEDSDRDRWREAAKRAIETYVEAVADFDAG